MEEILKELINDEIEIEIKNGRYYNITFENIKHLDTREIELKSKTKFISLIYDNGKWKMLLERWI